MREAWNQYVYIFRDEAVLKVVDIGKWSVPLQMRIGGRDEAISQPCRIALTTKEIAARGVSI